MDWLKRFIEVFPGSKVSPDVFQALEVSGGLCAVIGEDAVDACRALAVTSTVKPVTYKMIESVKQFVRTIEDIGTSCVIVASGIEDVLLRKRDNALLEDALIYHKRRWQSSGVRVLVVFPMSKKMVICQTLEHVIELAAFPDDRRAVLSPLLPDQLTIDIKCKRTGIVDAMIACSRFWTRSDMTKLTKQSCLIAMALDEPLSCDHVSRAHRLLFNPDRLGNDSFNASIQASSISHRCSIVPTSNVFDAFEGSQAAVDSSVSVASKGGVRLVALSGVSGSGKTMLARLLVTHAAPGIPIECIKASDVLCAVVGESEKRLCKLLSGKRALIIEDAEQLVPADFRETTGAVQRLLLILLHALDHLVNQEDCLIVLTTRHEALLHPRLTKRLSSSVRLDDVLAEDSRQRLFRRWIGESESLVNAAVTASEGFNGSACARLIREGGVKAIRRYISQKPVSSIASLTLEDFR